MPAPFSPLAASRLLVRTARTAALATLDPGSGAPFASLVTVATDPAGAPLMLLSTLAAHTRNLAADPRASLLIDDRASAAALGDTLAGSRLTLTGRVVRLDREEAGAAEAIARRRFLARHPEAEGYAGFRDFSLYRFEIATGHLVAGFGRINDIAGADLLVDVTGAEAIIAAEADIIAHMNEDHADATRGYATRHLGEIDGDWRVVGCDPAGLDLALTCETVARDARLEFGRTIRGLGPLRAVLKELADVEGRVEITKSI